MIIEMNVSRFKRVGKTYYSSNYKPDFSKENFAKSTKLEAK